MAANRLGLLIFPLKIWQIYIQEAAIFVSSQFPHGPRGATVHLFRAGIKYQKHVPLENLVKLAIVFFMMSSHLSANQSFLLGIIYFAFLKRFHRVFDDKIIYRVSKQIMALLVDIGIFFATLRFVRKLLASFTTYLSTLFNIATNNIWYGY